MPEKTRPIARTRPRLFVPLAAVLIGVPAPAQAEPPGVTWGEPTKVASGEAYQGPWRMNESQFHYVGDPTVVINEEGVVGVAWADQSRQDIYFQIYAPDGAKRFEQPVNVSRTPMVFSWLPRMVIAGSGPSSVYVLWQEIVFSGGSHGGEIFFARSSDGGCDAKNESSSPGSAPPLSLAMRSHSAGAASGS